MRAREPWLERGTGDEVDAHSESILDCEFGAHEGVERRPALELHEQVEVAPSLRPAIRTVSPSKVFVRMQRAKCWASPSSARGGSAWGDWRLLLLRFTFLVDDQPRT